VLAYVAAVRFFVLMPRRISMSTIHSSQKGELVLPVIVDLCEVLAAPRVQLLYARFTMIASYTPITLALSIRDFTILHGRHFTPLHGALV